MNDTEPRNAFTESSRDAARFVPKGPGESTWSTIGDLCEALLSHRGEVTGTAISCEILDRFEVLGNQEKYEFFTEVLLRFGVDTAAFELKLGEWEKTRSQASARALHFASEPDSQELFRRLNRTSGGTARLVAMRKELLSALKDHPGLQSLDNDLKHLLGSWFNRGFLELRRVDWSTSAKILEKIIEYEAVHQINGWDDLRNRVAARDRRLYGFFHPSLRDDPLIFVEVALVEEIPASIGVILADDRLPKDPNKAKVAVFYSISNCQDGLRGISFGNLLIKQVVEELRREFENIETFVTLSPIPGLRRWAKKALNSVFDVDRDNQQLELIEKLDTVTVAHDDIELNKALARLAAHYLVHVKSRSGEPADPVARFHLGNGACLEQINTSANSSTEGLEASWGVMVNYLYDLSKIEEYHEAFACSGHVTCSSRVQELADRLPH